MIDAPFCNAVSLLTGFTGWVLAVWSFLRPERDRSGWKLAGGGMACALALLAQLFAVQLETVAGDLETALGPGLRRSYRRPDPVCDNADL